MSGIEIRVCGRYKLQSVLKKRQKHTIYSAVNVQTEEQIIIKAEETKGKKDNPQSLLQEGKIMQGLQGGIGIPSMYWCGQQEDYNFIVMEYLGKSLEELFEKCNKKFTLKTALMVGEQLVNILQYFHFKNFVHREVSPANFLIGKGKKNNKIFLIDYSNTKRYRDPKTLEHYPYRQSGLSCDNMVFSSLNFHKGAEAARRDDMQSMILMLIYFLKGLPWQNAQGATIQQRSKAILDLKQSTTVEQLCEGLPRQFQSMIQHVRALGFEDKPDYTYFKNVFRQRMSKEGIISDFIFDWVLLPVQRAHIPVDHYPLKIEVIPNQEEFIRNHLELFRREEESGNRRQSQQVQQQVAPTKQSEIKSLKQSKQKDCLLF